MDKNLRQALERKEFFLVYQPQMEIESGKITGFEALLRWNHPELGLIPPEPIYLDRGEQWADPAHWGMGAADGVRAGPQMAGRGTVRGAGGGKCLRGAVSSGKFPRS